MIPSWKSLCCLLLVASLGAPGWADVVRISWSGSVRVGFTTTFTCSSFCYPNCNYTWNFKGSEISGSSFTWTPDGREDTVQLQCSVHNPKTGTSSSTTSIIEVKNQMSVRTSPANTVPALNQSLSLVCHDLASSDPQGPSDLVWYKDGQKVTLRENVQLLQNNLTLRFDSLLASDAGFYHCEIYFPTLQIRVHSLGFQLSFDPWNVTISGPDFVYPGGLGQFTCLTSCTLNVECIVNWQFRNGFPVGPYLSISGNKVKWTPSIPGTFQNFTCVAENRAVGRSAEDTKTVEVRAVPVSGSEPVQLRGLSVFYSFMVLLSAFLSIKF